MNDASSYKQRVKSRLPRRILILTICVIAGLFMLSFSGRKPTNLGLENGKLAALPDSPNCVSTQTDDQSKKMEPLEFSTDLATTMKAIEIAVSRFPRTKITSKSADYLHAESTSSVSYTHLTLPTTPYV